MCPRRSDWPRRCGEWDVFEWATQSLPCRCWLATVLPSIVLFVYSLSTRRSLFVFLFFGLVNLSVLFGAIWNGQEIWF